MVARQSISDIGRRHLQFQVAVGYPRGVDLREPHRDRGLGELMTKPLDDVGPSLVDVGSGESYRHALSTEPFHNGGKPPNGACRGIKSPGGKAVGTIAPGFSTPLAPRALLTLFLLSSPLAS